ncbi:acetylornithine transaminase [Paenibacillus naphthalenovorans]|uniref:Acetylornithine aminotransferase n=1 Tax=Paenibacillus naphthalenovorans TaxID=162209 RepID=A0A0U2VY89_9BACL|nr:acetylornithine transaminase [Paenibacillus naphthalenovorans]ALS24455.1 acetylornithine aminotransferase [Paenibacillus naphthalenovorans]GCL73702.1 acetylornithine transaminase [Paenibacillus naphthalenovorans]SDJ13412.1 acetylornithine aminotransferase [Paenibacillus naphthalenovorans]
MGESQSALFPNYGRYPLTFVKGEGSRLWDENGKEYLDLMCGLAVTNLGHAPKQVKERLKNQVDTLWHTSNLFHIPDQQKLAELLVANSCADAAFFCNSGAEANEAAIKLARRYFQKVIGKPERFEIITFHMSFHGRTLATLTATGQDKVKEGFAPLPEGFVYAPFNDAEALEKLIGDRTCAIMLEMVQGEGGVNPADPAFVKRVAELCEQHGLLLIVDEIQTGMGRTGKLFAYEHYGIEPDVFTLAKGLGSGMPIGAMLGKEKLREAFSAGSHGSTFGGNYLSTAAGVATVETILEEKLPERAAELGQYVIGELEQKLAGNPLVQQIRGLGLLIGIGLNRPAAELISELHAEGILVVSAGPNVIRLAPSLLISKEDLDRGIQAICGILAKKAGAAV